MFGNKEESSMQDDSSVRSVLQFPLQGKLVVFLPHRPGGLPVENASKSVFLAIEENTNPMAGGWI